MLDKNLNYTNETYYTFNDVQFMPLYSPLGSRSDADATSRLGKTVLPFPVISANMKDITGPKMAVEMFKNGGLGILHRFGTVEEDVKDFKETLYAISVLIQDECFRPEKSEKNMVWSVVKHLSQKSVEEMNDCAALHVGVSIGVNESDKPRLKALVEAGAKLICIDIAHGHCLKMKEMLAYIKAEYGDKDLYIIAGNIASIEGARDLVEWGASCVKVGIGPGMMCETRKNTGVGIPQLSAIKNIRDELPNIVMISDGGIKYNGDIAKALKYADAVMVGGMLAGTSETPGHVYKNKDGVYYKVFGGSASAENKVKNGAAKEFIEGVVSEVPFRGHVKYVLREAYQNLQSSFSYAGAFNLKDFQKNSILVKISGGGKQESKI